MTHDESLAKIDHMWNDDFDYVIEQNRKALRAVVELHKPINNPNFPDSDIWCWQCADGRGYAKYPCPTIQAIS